MLYLCHDDYFSFSPKLGLQSSLDDFLLSYAKILTYYDIGNQNVRFVSTNLRQSLYIGVTDYGIYNAVGRYGSERIEAALVGMW